MLHRPQGLGGVPAPAWLPSAEVPPPRRQPWRTFVTVAVGPLAVVGLLAVLAVSAGTVSMVVGLLLSRQTKQTLAPVPPPSQQPFSVLSRLSLAGDVSSMAVGDISLDGADDVLCWAGGQVLFYPRLQPAAGGMLSAPSTSFGSVAVGGSSGSIVRFGRIGGAPAVVVAGWAGGSISAYRANGQQVFPRRAVRMVIPAMEAADLDGDGSDEVVFVGERGEVACLGAAGVPRWTYAPSRTGAVQCLSIVDIDRDGRPEVVAASYDGTPVVSARGKQVASLAAPPRPRAVIAADLARDGSPEFLFVVRAYRPGRRGGASDAALVFQDGCVQHVTDIGPVESHAPREQMSHGDVDGDGKEEWVVAVPDGTVRVYDGGGRELGRQAMGAQVAALAVVPGRRAGDKAQVWAALGPEVTVLQWRR